MPITPAPNIIAPGPANNAPNPKAAAANITNAADPAITPVQLTPENSDIANANGIIDNPKAAIPNNPLPIALISIILIPVDNAVNPKVINGAIAPTAAINKIPGIAVINTKNAGPATAIPINPFNISPSGLNDLMPSAKFFKKSFIF